MLVSFFVNICLRALLRHSLGQKKAFRNMLRKADKKISFLLEGVGDSKLYTKIESQSKAAVFGMRVDACYFFIWIWI